jgi:hypothetical protein
VEVESQLKVEWTTRDSPEAHAGRLHVKILQLSFVLLAQQADSLGPFLVELLQFSFHLKSKSSRSDLDFPRIFTHLALKQSPSHTDALLEFLSLAVAL